MSTALLTIAAHIACFASATLSAELSPVIPSLGDIDLDAVLNRIESCQCADGDYVFLPSIDNGTIPAAGTQGAAWERWIKFLTNVSRSDPADGNVPELVCSLYRTCTPCPTLMYCPPGGLCWNPVSCLLPIPQLCFAGGLSRPQYSPWGVALAGLFLLCCCGGCGAVAKVRDRKRLERAKRALEERLLQSRLLQAFGEAVLERSHADGPDGSDAGGDEREMELVTHEFRGLKRRPTSQQIGIAFSNLGLVLPNGKCVLRNVSGEFERGMLTAVMGPSGSGKTTFLNVLCGRATYGDMLGSIRINGRAGRVDQFRTLFGFVPQDDIVFPDLTVRENLRFSAALRLPPHCASIMATARKENGCAAQLAALLCCKAQVQRRHDIVNDVLHVLGIDHIADEVVGNVEKRGISGGQRKRVNIGLEMVADPAVLFLDEPTSGLDSTASTLVLAALKEVAQLGVTVATVIHQPRYSIFTLFDQTLLLARGGRAVYLGWSHDAVAYFEALSFTCPARVNPADFFLDVISGEVPCRAVKGFDAVRDLPQVWSALQEAHKAQRKEEKEETRAATEHMGSDERRASAPVSAAAIAFAAQVGRVFDALDVERRSVLTLEQCEQLLTPTLNSRGIDPSANNIRATIAAVNDDGIKKKHDDVGATAGNLTRARFVERMAIFRARAVALRREEGSGFIVGGLDGYGDEVGAAQRRTRNRMKNGFCLTYKHALTRNLRQVTRHVGETVLDAALAAFPAVVIGCIYPGPTWSLFSDSPLVAFLAFLVLGLIQTIATVRQLSSERLLFYRERARGLHVAAYFAAKDTMGMLDTLVRASLFSGVAYSFLVPQMGSFRLFLISTFVCYFASGVGFFLAAVLNPNAALIAAVILPTTTGAMFSGLIAAVPNALSYISFIRFATEWFIVSEVHAIDKATGFDPNEPNGLSLTTIFLYSNEARDRRYILYSNCFLYSTQTRAHR